MKNIKIKLGTSAAAVTALIIASFILFNVFTGMLTDRFFLKIDMTSNKLYDISQKTVDILNDMPSNVTINFICSEPLANANFLPLVEIFQKYSSLSDGKITVKYLDPNTNPRIKEDFGLSTLESNDIIISGPNRVKRVTQTDLYYFETNDYGEEEAVGFNIEQSLTSAILYVMAETVPGVVFTEGHGEQTASVSNLKGIFEKSGFSVSTLNLGMNQIPDDTLVMVIAAPTTDFSADEIEVIDKFTRTGGNCIYLPYEYTLPKLHQYLTEWGIEIEDSIIFDSVRNYSAPQYVVPYISSIEMFKDLPTSIYAFVAAPRVLNMAFTERSGRKLSVMMTTSNDSYAKKLDSDFSDISKAPDDAAGPFDIAILSELSIYDSVKSEYTYSKMVVMPYSVFPDTILNISAYLNNYIAAETIRYLNPTGQNVYIAYKNPAYTILNLVGLPAIIYMAVLVIILPIGIMVFGFVLWFRRRHL